MSAFSTVSLSDSMTHIQGGRPLGKLSSQSNTPFFRVDEGAIRYVSISIIQWI